MSAVAGRIPRIRRHLYEATGLHEVFNDSNIRLEVKSSPGATYQTLLHLCEREGAVNKLNDSGSWKCRRALLVPHTFLYYFAEATASTDLTPHGVIDLELYTDVQAVDGNVVRLSPADSDSPIRTFYLRLEDEQEAEAWAQTIRETRFDRVREERDALRSAKAVMTEQLVNMEENLRSTKALLETSQKREGAAMSQLARSNAMEAKRVEQVQALLASAHCGDGGDGNENYASRAAGGGGCSKDCVLSELAALEEAIAERAREAATLKKTNATLTEELDLATESRRRDAAAALNLLNQERRRAAEEATARKVLEDEMRDLLVELEETRAEREEARVNLGVVAVACREAEAKSRELQEHRRVLAREVKALRAEQRRLSAALSCATTAASAAAATVAAANANVASSGNRGRSSSAMSWTAGDITRETGARVPGLLRSDDRVAPSLVRKDHVAEDEKSSSRNVDTAIRDPPGPHTGRKAENFRWEEMGREVADRSPGTMTVQSWLRPTSLDAPTSSGGAEDPPNAESGATSPEVDSPGLCLRNQQSGRYRASHWPPSPPSSRTSPNADASLSGRQTPAHEKTLEEIGAAAAASFGNAGHEGDVQQMRPATEYDVVTSEITQPPDFGNTGSSQDSSGVTVSRLSLSSSPTLPGESRFNQMVQTLSAGLRESRKPRRTPLLGLLDSDSDAGDADPDDGGVTDGTDGDSRHDATKADERESAWSARSTSGSGTSATVAIDGAMVDCTAANDKGIGDAQASEVDEGGREEVALPPDEAVCVESSGRSDGERATSDGKQSPTAEVSGAGVDSSTVTAADTGPRAASRAGSGVESFCPQATSGSSGWRSSLEAAADVAVEKATKATESSADWFRKVGRDSENKTPRPQQDGEGSRLPQPLEGGRGVMVEAAEEIGQLPTAAAAAAAAARRWEAKLKGSFASMTSGVRWGMV